MARPTEDAEGARDSANGGQRTRPRLADPIAVGTGFGALAALAYTGANMALRQLASTGGVDWAIWVTCMKAVPAAAVAWGIIAYRGSRGLPALPPSRLIPVLLAAGLVMQLGGNVMFQLSLSLGGLALTIPLVFASVILSSAWLGRLFLNEPITLRTGACMLLLILAIVLLSFGAEEATRAMIDDVSPWLVAGSVLAACSAGLSYGINSIVIRRALTREVSLSATLVLLNTTGVIVLGLISLARLGPERLLATPPVDFGIMLLAGTFNAAAFFSLGAALQRIAAVHVNLLNASQTAMAAAAGVLFFAERVTPWLIAGTVLTIVGLSLMNGRRSRQREEQKAVADG